MQSTTRNRFILNRNIDLGGDCGRRDSQAKYLTRARSRVSSFWSLTRQEEGGPVKHLCLLEVWHMNYGNEIRLTLTSPQPLTRTLTCRRCGT